MKTLLLMVALLGAQAAWAEGELSDDVLGELCGVEKSNCQFRIWNGGDEDVLLGSKIHVTQYHKLKAIDDGDFLRCSGGCPTEDGTPAKKCVDEGVTSAQYVQCTCR